MDKIDLTVGQKVKIITNAKIKVKLPMYSRTKFKNVHVNFEDVTNLFLCK